MKTLASVLVILFSVLTEAQELTIEKKAVKAAIEIFFEGFHKGDTTLIKQVLADRIVLQTAYKNKKGEAILVTEEPEKLIKAIAERPETQKWDERLLSFNIQIDGLMAHVWTPYEFWFNDVFSHCGVNSFQLFKDDEQWKIIYLIDTRRKEGCNQP
ncbi:3-methyl-2-oxobutanoate hydroxymethyltransferase [Tamlana nanhaiensis]|uniref:3-methyl-2-oxobutanoate hydroxymethyltransferase n=1 Tax=Neotamlana nanhaiensis TaxID=1382798 RepID=A0A0D7W5Z7_9FLAO|nr:nuclear transport factor 2 family protein [Tamlana nanhaiensis]KJD34545.1 3-methyl-2-oxobutanoate hydroxymethyltransferase [Tamlana nanhaiensis]